MITLTKTINKLPKNPLLKTNKGEHRFEMNIKTRTGNPQQTTPQAPCFPHFFPPPRPPPGALAEARGQQPPLRGHQQLVEPRLLRAQLPEASALSAATLHRVPGGALRGFSVGHRCPKRGQKNHALLGGFACLQVLFEGMWVRVSLAVSPKCSLKAASLIAFTGPNFGFEGTRSETLSFHTLQLHVALLSAASSAPRVSGPPSEIPLKLSENSAFESCGFHAARGPVPARWFYRQESLNSDSSCA